MKISESYSSPYLRAADLQGRPVRAVINDVSLEDMDGTGNDVKPVVSFQQRSKKLPLNKTNALTLAEFLGDETDAWNGIEIELYPAKASFQGKLVDSIRVRIPEPLPEVDPDQRNIPF